MATRDVARVVRWTLAGCVALAGAAPAQQPERLDSWCDAGKPILFAGIENPELVKLLERVQLSGDQLGEALARMTERRGSDTIVAIDFMARHPEAWRGRVPDAVAARVLASLR